MVGDEVRALRTDGDGFSLSRGYEAHTENLTGEIVERFGRAVTPRSQEAVEADQSRSTSDGSEDSTLGVGGEKAARPDG